MKDESVPRLIRAPLPLCHPLCLCTISRERSCFRRWQWPPHSNRRSRRVGRAANASPIRARALRSPKSWNLVCRWYLSLCRCSRPHLLMRTRMRPHRFRPRTRMPLYRRTHPNTARCSCCRTHRRTHRRMRRMRLVCQVSSAIWIASKTSLPITWCMWRACHLLPPSSLPRHTTTPKCLTPPLQSPRLTRAAAPTKFLLRSHRLSR